MSTVALRLPKYDVMLTPASSDTPDVDIWLSAKRRFVWYELFTPTRHASAFDKRSAR